MTAAKSVSIQKNSDWKKDPLSCISIIYESLGQLQEFDMDTIKENFHQILFDSLPFINDESSRIMVVQFYIFALSLMEKDYIRAEFSKICSIGILSCINESKRKFVLRSLSLEKYWNNYEKKAKKQDMSAQNSFLYTILNSAVDALNDIEGNAEYLEKVFEFFVDILSQMFTRRFALFLIEEVHLFAQFIQAVSGKESPSVHKLKQLFVTLKFYHGFEIDNVTGKPLKEIERVKLYTDSIIQLQKAWFKLFNNEKHLQQFAFLNFRDLDDPKIIVNYLGRLDDDQFYSLCEELNTYTFNGSERYSVELLTLSLLDRYEKRYSLRNLLRNITVYPDEIMIFDDSLVRNQYYDGVETLSIPKLNMQFLSIQDFLLRNFNLFRLESTFEIRNDIEKCISSMQPFQTYSLGTDFNGWSRMAVPIHTLAITQIGAPLLGEEKASFVTAEVTFSIGNYTQIIKDEWNDLGNHDVLFLIRVNAKEKTKTKFDPTCMSFKEHYGIEMIRGCEVYETIEDSEKSEKAVNMKTLKIKLDPNQFRLDKLEDYSKFNVIVRRKSKENNFKAVLESIKDLLGAEPELPEWLNEVILGYAESEEKPKVKLNTFDLFVDEDHLRSVTGIEPSGTNLNEWKDWILDEANETVEGKASKIISNRNKIRFTPKQVEAIFSGMKEGLTMVVGPPGCGKTDVVCQLISNLYHSNPNEKIVIVTRSNQALNQIFEKISQLEIAPRHLLRLGHGADDVFNADSSRDYTRKGRLEWFEKRKLSLLEQVTALQRNMTITGDHGYTCETALHFYERHVVPLWAKYKTGEIECPFTLEENQDADFYYEFYVQRLFEEIYDIRPLEVLRTNYDRYNYLILKLSRVVAMTSTYAAIKRKDLEEMGFAYTTLVMEEASQILEIESFLPCVLQKESKKLKRMVMVGDHHQLPPVVKHQGFAKYGKMEQSLFYRLIRLGTNYIQLNSQGRSRPEIADLYREYYSDLQDMTAKHPDNVGFKYNLQFIDVSEYEGKGETEPMPYFYQNLGEAEYCVALYQYMRLQGYKSENIVILTTYNGQKELIKDVLTRTCSWNSFFGNPRKVTTVDHFQGQQSDHVILSLVKTKSKGHIQDYRRLIVALSRAKYGLYVFGRYQVFKELMPNFPPDHELRLTELEDASLKNLRTFIQEKIKDVTEQEE